MKKYLVIKLNTVSDVVTFNKLVNTVSHDVNLRTKDSKYVVDAKSLLGLYALDLRKELCLEPITDNEAKLLEFTKLFKDFVVTR